MRFDDRLATVLNGDPESPRGRATMWRQLTDLLAQSGPQLESAIVARSLQTLALLARDVPLDVQVDHVSAIAAQCRSAPLLVLLVNQHPALAAAMLQTARMDDQAWLTIIPHIGPLGRTILRRRHDIGGLPGQALRLFAIGDLALPSPAPIDSPIDHADEAPQRPVEISDLVRRIEEYRQRRRDEPPLPLPEVDASATEDLRFVTDLTGRIIDVEQAPRGRFVGVELGQPARAGDAGCDAGTARRVAKRAIIHDGRVMIVGDDGWSGIWMCDAQPRFASADGSFQGYVGTLRRPAAHELAERPVPAPAAQEGLPPDLLRQLMHELRSPLNAIAGFAQLIEGQYAGPVAQPYRLAARTIMSESGGLIGAIEEIDMLARMSAAPIMNREQGDCDLGVVLGSVLAELAPGLSRKAASIRVDDPVKSAGLVLPVAETELYRALSLLLQPVGASLGESETISIVLTANAHGRCTVAIDMADNVLTDPSRDTAGAPGLGLAFAAATQSVSELGGTLSIVGRQYILNMPTLSQPSAAGGIVS